MMSRAFVVVVCVCFVSLSGCIVVAHLDTVPSTQSFFGDIKVSGAFVGRDFYADLNADRPWHKRECHGQWRLATAPQPFAKDPMAAIWETARGAGYYTDTILGAQECALGSGTCKNGTTLAAEICRLKPNGNRKGAVVGVAQDSGNVVYKF